MRPRWELKEYTLIKYLRECVWSLERVESRINMIRHSRSTPCFIPEEVEPKEETADVPRRPQTRQRQRRPRPLSCLSPRDLEDHDGGPHSRPQSCISSSRDYDDDDDVPFYLDNAQNGPEVASSEATSTVTTPDPPTSARVSPTRSFTHSPPRIRSRCASSSPSRPGTRSTLSPVQTRVMHRKRKTSMPLPIRIPEDREAYCQSPLFSPLGSPPTIGSPACRRQVHKQTFMQWQLQHICRTLQRLHTMLEN